MFGVWGVDLKIERRETGKGKRDGGNVRGLGEWT